jgi:hypothetical protein
LSDAKIAKTILSIAIAKDLSNLVVDTTAMLEAEATVYKHTKGNTLYLSIPARLGMDSAFPFKPGDKVSIEIYDEGAILVSKIKT